MSVTDPAAVELAEMRARNQRVALGHPRNPDDVRRLLALGDRLLGFHQQGTRGLWCKGCTAPWPCPTYRIIAGALLGDDDE